MQIQIYKSLPTPQSPTRNPPLGKTINYLGNQPNELRNEYTPEPGSLQAQMLEPRNEGGAVLRERCRLQLPKRLHLPPGRAHACEGSSLFTSRGFVLKPTQWRELPKQNQVGSTVSGTVQ